MYCESLQLVWLIAAQHAGRTILPTMLQTFVMIVTNGASKPRCLRWPELSQCPSFLLGGFDTMSHSTRLYAYAQQRSFHSLKVLVKHLDGLNVMW
jgi:hypothetical protein